MSTFKIVRPPFQIRESERSKQRFNQSELSKKLERQQTQVATYSGIGRFSKETARDRNRRDYYRHHQGCQRSVTRGQWRSVAAAWRNSCPMVTLGIRLQTYCKGLLFHISLRSNPLGHRTQPSSPDCFMKISSTFPFSSTQS